MEDIDPARSKSHFAEAIVRDLAWMGLSWEYGPGARGSGALPPEGPFTQSGRLESYGAILALFQERGLAYPCYCTRRELRSIAGAPHADDAGAPYPGICRSLAKEEQQCREAEGRTPSWRLLCPQDTVWAFEDAVMGGQSFTLGSCGGDFALRRSDGVFAYQLAVVADDIAMGVTHVVRGSDILCSTPRQMYLYSLLDAPLPEYAHVPLLLDHEGERLAKRHQALTLHSLREAGVRPETLVGWLAAASGLAQTYQAMPARACLPGFSFAAVSRKPLRLPPSPIEYFLGLQRQDI